MTCNQLPSCGAESLGFLAMARIGSSKFTKQWSFGTFAAGSYMVQYVNGAIHLGPLGWSALSNDAQNVVLVACGGSLRISLPEKSSTLPSNQALAEASAAGTQACFNHSGGDISIEYSAALYSQNTDGTPNPTFNLLSLVPVTAAGGATPPLGPFPSGRGGCAEKVDCPDSIGSPTRNISSEAPDVPQNPFQPIIPAVPTNPFPDQPVDSPPVPPPLNNATYTCYIIAKPTNGPDTRCDDARKLFGLLFPNMGECATSNSGICFDPGDGSGKNLTMADCLNDCNPTCESGCYPPLPPPPDPPPPPPASVSYNCTNEGCIDPGDGSGTFSDIDTCNVSCSIVCGEITPSGPLLGIAGLPVDCSCSLPVTFSMSGGKFPKPSNGNFYELLFEGIGYVLEWNSETSVTLDLAGVCALAAATLTVLGGGTYSGCIEYSGGGPCCPVTFDVSTCGNCDNTKFWNPCQPTYPTAGGCPKACAGSCCDSINSLSIGGTITNLSLIFLNECMGVGPPDFYLGTKHFICSFVNTVIGGASYKTDSYYDVTRVA